MRYLKTYELFKRRDDFETDVNSGDIVKLDKDYIKSRDDIDWSDHQGVKRDFTEKELDGFYVLVNFDSNYGYALRRVNLMKTSNDKMDFLGWVPPRFIRHITPEEKEEYNKYIDFLKNLDKYNL